MTEADRLRFFVARSDKPRLLKLSMFSGADDPVGSRIGHAGGIREELTDARHVYLRSSWDSSNTHGRARMGEGAIDMDSCKTL